MRSSGLLHRLPRLPNRPSVSQQPDHREDLAYDDEGGEGGENDAADPVPDVDPKQYCPKNQQQCQETQKDLDQTRREGNATYTPADGLM